MPIQWVRRISPTQTLENKNEMFDETMEQMTGGVGGAIRIPEAHHLPQPRRTTSDGSDAFEQILQQLTDEQLCKSEHGSVATGVLSYQNGTGSNRLADYDNVEDNVAPGKQLWSSSASLQAKSANVAAPGFDLLPKPSSTFKNSGFNDGTGALVGRIVRRQMIRHQHQELWDMWHDAHDSTQNFLASLPKPAAAGDEGGNNDDTSTGYWETDDDEQQQPSPLLFTNPVVSDPSCPSITSSSAGGNEALSTVSGSDTEQQQQPPWHLNNVMTMHESSNDSMNGDDDEKLVHALSGETATFSMSAALLKNKRTYDDMLEEQVEPLPERNRSSSFQGHQDSLYETLPPTGGGRTRAQRRRRVSDVSNNKGKAPGSTQSSLSKVPRAPLSALLLCGGDSPEPFGQKLYRLVTECSADDDYRQYISWVRHGRAFHIHDEKNFMTHVSPLYFAHGSIQSLKRQLRHYAFTLAVADGSYSHPGLQEGRPDLLYQVRRVK